MKEKTLGMHGWRPRAVLVLPRVIKEGLVELRENLKMKYEMSEDDYKVLEVLIEERKPHKTGPQWKFSGSLYYAFVTLALIGRLSWH